MGKAALKTMTQDQINLSISYLKRALYSEVVAITAYRNSLAIIKGKALDDMEDIIEANMKEEYIHVEELTARLNELEAGDEHIIVDPAKLNEYSPDAYKNPTSGNIEYLGKYNQDYEVGAVAFYLEAYNAVKDFDPITASLFRHTAGDEIKHEQDLANVLTAF